MADTRCFGMAIEKAKKIQPDIKKNRIEHPNHPLLEGEAEEVFSLLRRFLKGIRDFRVMEFDAIFFKTQTENCFSCKAAAIFQ